ncbi:MAG: hypothetical protein Ct9H300mP1_39370 [Planctomycetaceae bacterium]|nr:MAG: hypothetical protein Ct9H300mP1_39370 [Planctomycetaceae bacterium]
MGNQVWDASFLPAHHTGTRLVPGQDPVPHLKSPLPSVSLGQLEQLMLSKINRRTPKTVSGILVSRPGCPPSAPPRA